MPAKQWQVDVRGLKDLRRYLRTLPEELFTGAKKAVRTSTFRVHERVTDRVENGPIHSRTGNLSRSLQPKVEGQNLRELRGRVYSDARFASYAAVHEFGALIKAKNAYKNLPGGPFLNIPSDANKTPAGVQRKTAKQVFRQGGFIVPITAPKARYMVMLREKPMFWLVKQVRIPAQLGLRRESEKEIPTLLSNLDRLLQEGMEDG